MKVKVITNSTFIKDEQICEFSNQWLESLRDDFDEIIRTISPVIMHARWIENENDVLFGYVVVMKDLSCCSIAVKKIEG